MSLTEAAAAAAALGPLPLGRARARARGFHGSHARRMAGPGSEFWQYRALEPGEAVDRVDWRRSARSDALYVREREREDPVRLWLWVDGSGSMDFTSNDRLPTKRACAHLLAGALALAAHEAGEKLADLSHPDDRAPPHRLVETLGRTPNGTPPMPPLRPGDAVLLVGDFLDDTPEPWVARAAAQGAVGIALAIADPAEIAFPFSGRIHFEGVEPDESEREFARAEALREEYLAAWGAHEARLDAINRITGWTCLRHRTNQPVTEVLAAAARWLGG